jgi:hypothetical protein
MRHVEQIVLQSQAEVPSASVTVFPALNAPVIREQRGFSQRYNIFFLGGYSN